MNRIAQFDRSFQAAGVATDQLWRPSPFRSRSRWESFGHALRGLRDAWQTQPNLRLQAAAGTIAVAAGALCRLSAIEWLWISFAIGLVIFAELMNTAIEQTVDFVVGEQVDPLARCVKDLAAGFVLVACLIAVAIGALTFGPHLLAR